MKLVIRSVPRTKRAVRVFVAMRHMRISASGAVWYMDDSPYSHFLPAGFRHSPTAKDLARVPYSVQLPPRDAVADWEPMRREVAKLQKAMGPGADIRLETK